MSIPERKVLYHEKDLLDRAIEEVTSQSKELTSTDLGRISTAAQIQAGIDRYRLEADGMTADQLRAEDHNSKLLGRHLEQTGNPRPPRCHAHAIVAGKHQYAAQLRLIMAVIKIRIDDADNGCWLPENSAATPHPAFPAAPPHSRIHRYNYFFWLFTRLSIIRNQGIFRQNLQIIAQMLQTGQLPDYLLKPKGIGLPEGRKFA